MIKLTPAERQLRAVMIDRAQSAKSSEDARVTYGDLAVHAFPDDPPNPHLALPIALGHVSMYEVEHGRPMLSALVVNQASGVAGEGFSKLGRHLGLEVVDDDESFWRWQLAEVIAFWRDPDPTRVPDALHDRLLAEIRSLKRKL
jgi:hypothetical protein